LQCIGPGEWVFIRPVSHALTGSCCLACSQREMMPELAVLRPFRARVQRGGTNGSRLNHSVGRWDAAPTDRSATSSTIQCVCDGFALDFNAIEAFPGIADLLGSPDRLSH
jgi:hypothetical protein